MLEPYQENALQLRFGNRLRRGVPLARHTSARVGGPAEILLKVTSADELAQAMQIIWEQDLACTILGGGSNVLVSDAGIAGIVLLNQARKVRFEPKATPPMVWAESGANLGALARQAATKGLAGLAWAAGIPGTIGGALVGNAGAHGGDTAGNLLLADILHREGYVRELWPQRRLEFAYRTSLLKRQPGRAVVLAASLRLESSTTRAVREEMDAYVRFRHRTQPPGASMGSMFKNPPGDHAGRLIEAAGLKGSRIGDAQISELHANFFVNLGRASAREIYDLIQMARSRVADQFGIELELEIECVGTW